MSFWSAVVVIVAIVALAKVMQSRFGASNQLTPPRQDEMEGPTVREKELQNEVESLRERVKVLERIATDPARRTAEEIEKLRDE